MAGLVATCAYFSGGAQPPLGPHRVPAFYESAPEPRQRRGRGGVKGYEIAQKVLQDGKITVEFDEARGTWKVLGKNGAWFDSAIGIHTGDICEPFHDAWKDISDMDNRTIQNRMLKISEINKTNRSNQKYPSLHGRVSYFQHRNKKFSTETQEPMSAIDNWADMHRCGASWNTLEEERQTQRTQSTSSSTRPAFDEHGVLEQVLGMRRGHKIGVGPTLFQKHYSGASPSSASSYSDATSSAQPDPRPNIQLPTIDRPEPVDLDAPLQMMAVLMMSQLLAMLQT
ncbi:hypothetical protein L484_004524 [Morus notabilis]|uniref:Uncharacterized protein n=1 Tax=Morus notabilis TaxID=981085 RepID=W9QJK4_9ROSA|nr:hypothetical protein L484_004524 [Morus notabilis]